MGRLSGAYGTCLVRRVLATKGDWIALGWLKSLTNSLFIAGLQEQFNDAVR